MAKIAIALKIDVTKLDKARFYKGQKGTYADLNILVDLDQTDDYGNHGFITQSVTKEEREAGVKLPILGNGKIYWRDQVQQQGYQPPPAQQQQKQNAPPVPPPADDDDLPF
jgi:hypothetical protein